MSRFFSSEPSSIVIQDSILNVRNILIGILLGSLLVLGGLVVFNTLVANLGAEVESPNLWVIRAEDEKERVSNWQEFENKLHHYKIKYPSQIMIYDLNPVLAVDSASPRSFIFTNVSNNSLDLKALPEKSFVLIIMSTLRRNSSYSSTPLKEMVQSTYTTNTSYSKVLRPLAEIKFLNNTAYTYSLKNTPDYSGFNFAYSFPNNSLKIIIFEQAGVIYEVVYKQSPIAEKILKTMTIVD